MGPGGEQVRKGEGLAVKGQQYKAGVKSEEFTSDGDGVRTS